MSKKIIYFILFLIIVIILFIILINKNNIDESKDNNIIIKNSDNTDNSEEEYEISEKYNEELLKEFDLEIKGMTDKIVKKINNINEFYYNLKKYMHQNGLIDSNILELKNYQESNNELKLKFELQDDRNIKIIATINLDENTYKFIYY